MNHTPRYQLHDALGLVYGVFHLPKPGGGTRRRYRKLATYVEAGLDAQGDPLPGTQDAERDALLGARWWAALEALSAQAALGGLPMFRAWSDAWLKSLVGRRRRGRTLEMYEHSRDRWLRLMGDLPLLTLKRRDVRLFITRLQGEGLSDVTVNVDLRHLRACLRWISRELQDDEVDFRPPHVELLPVTARHVDLPANDVLRVAWDELTARIAAGLAGKPHRRAGAEGPRQNRRVRAYELRAAINLRRMLVLSRATLARPGELTSRKITDIDWGAHRCAVIDNELFEVKERREKYLDWQPAVTQFLREDLRLTPGDVWLFSASEPDPITRVRPPAWPEPHSVTTAGARLWRALGISGRTWKPWHDVGRRAGITRLVNEGGASYEEAGLIAGHQQIDTTRGYVVAEAQRKRSILSRVDLTDAFPLPPLAPETAVAPAVEKSKTRRIKLT